MQTRAWVEAQLLSGLERYWGKDRLTVLAYHRICSPSDFGFFEPVISAAPDDFARQMDIIAERYNAISLSDLLSWMDGSGTIPPNAALITFDDGYRDNLDQALPVLQERELPALLFLATEHIDRRQPFFWDSAAYSFNHTSATEADLPILGPRSWVSPQVICTEWLETAKRVPHSRRAEVTEQLGRQLGVSMPEDAYDGELLTWDEVRLMASRGFDFGSHTLSHPILTELPASEVRRELAESRERLEDELGVPIRSLAYPNGTPADFDVQIQEMATEAGYSVAFTLVPGPARSTEVRERPMEIRRIGIYLSDRDRRFRAKLAGGGRAKSSLS